MGSWDVTETRKRNSEIMDDFLNRDVRIRLVSPRGYEHILPRGRFVYNEGTDNTPEGYYLEKQGYRLLPSQFIGATIVHDKAGQLPVLTFGVWRNNHMSLN